MSKRLVFIDDDQTELDAFKEVIGQSYVYVTILWPNESEKLLRISAPDIFVSDLYLPPLMGDTSPTDIQKKVITNATRDVANRFINLSADQSLGDKSRLQETIKAIREGEKLLELQWRNLGQSPDHGLSVCRNVRLLHPEVPFVFYSRKMTPEDVIRVLRAGAVDAIRKGAVETNEVLSRLIQAQKFFPRPEFHKLRLKRFNTNVTLETL